MPWGCVVTPHGMKRATEPGMTRPADLSLSGTQTIKATVQSTGNSNPLYRAKPARRAPPIFPLFSPYFLARLGVSNSVSSHALIIDLMETVMWTALKSDLEAEVDGCPVTGKYLLVMHFAYADSGVQCMYTQILGVTSSRHFEYQGIPFIPGDQISEVRRELVREHFRIKQNRFNEKMLRIANAALAPHKAVH